jgi:hypothetical protein
MKSTIFTRVYTKCLLGSLGLGALMTLTPSAQAFNVNKGTDYLRTPAGGSQFTVPLPGGGSITFPVIGLPIGNFPATSPAGGYSGFADTIVNRLDNVTFDGGITNINVVGLSLKSNGPVNIPGAGLFDIFIGLNPLTMSTGTIKIFETPRTFNADFKIEEKYVVVPAGTLIPVGDEFIKGLIAGCGVGAAYQCGTSTTFLRGSGPWQPTNVPPAPFSPPKIPLASFLNVTYSGGCEYSTPPASPPCLVDSGTGLSLVAPAGITDLDVLWDFDATSNTYNKFTRWTFPAGTGLTNYASDNNDPLTSQFGVPYDPSELSNLKAWWTTDNNPYPLSNFIEGGNLVEPGLDKDFYLSGFTQLQIYDPLTGLPSNEKIHGVVPTNPTPGPLPILGASTAYAFARRLRKRCRESVKVS